MGTGFAVTALGQQGSIYYTDNRVTEQEEKI